MKVKIAKWGNSLAMRLPKNLVSELELKEGAVVEMEREGTRMVAETRPARHSQRYRLADLLAEIDRVGPECVPETVSWGPDLGSEVVDDAYSQGEITLDDLLSGRARDKNAS